MLDTAGQEDYPGLQRLSYPGADVVLICFSLNSPDSLENVWRKWVPEIKGVPFLLVGNKRDLRDGGKRADRVSDGEAMALSIDAVAFMECSAKAKTDASRVPQIMEIAVRAGLKYRNLKAKNFIKAESHRKCTIL